MRWGISARQGGHHVAQKSTTTTFPAKSWSLTALPLTSVNVHPGADSAIALPAIIKARKRRTAVETGADREARLILMVSYESFPPADLFHGLEFDAKTSPTDPLALIQEIAANRNCS